MHFQDVLQAYSPYETLLEITDPDSLNDTSLAASFPLHTASPSASNSRLHEISEDGEDPGQAPKRPGAPHSYSSGSMFGTARYKAEKRVEQLMSGERQRKSASTVTMPSIQVTSDTSSTLTTLSPPPHKPSISQFIVRDESGQRSITSLGSQRSMASVTEYASSDASGKSGDSTAVTIEAPESTEAKAESAPAEASSTSKDDCNKDPPAEPAGTTRDVSSRPSITEPRPSTDTASRKYDDDPYDFSKLEYKPKVKLGPRPVNASDKAKRPGSTGIAVLPANFRSAQQKRQEPARTNSQQSSIAANNPIAASTLPAGLPKPPPIPDLPEYNPRPVSRGSVKSLPSHKSTAMTPDKLRLMKAVELRKKQMRKSNPQAATFIQPKEEDLKEMPKLSKTEDTEEQAVAAASPAEPQSAPEESISASNQPTDVPTEDQPEDKPPDEQPTSTKKPDSGIELHYEEPSTYDAGKEEAPPSSPTVHENTLALLESPRTQKAELEPTAEPTAEPTITSEVPEESSEAASPDQAGSPEKQPIEESEVEKVHDEQVTPQQPKPLLPSIVMADGTRPESSAYSRPTSAGADPDEEPSSRVTTGDPSTPELLTVAPRRIASDLAKRRRGIVEPLQLEQERENSGSFASDEEFLEELQSATVQEATSMRVSRSPVAPSVPRRPSFHSDRSMPSVRSINIRRSTANLLDAVDANSDRGSPDPAGRSSASPPLSDSQDPRYSLGRNVSLGISNRIQALSGATTRDSSPPPLPDMSWREGKSAVRSPPRTRTSSYKAALRHSARMSGQVDAPPAESNAVWNVQHDPSANRDSVSVSARIVRPRSNISAEDDPRGELPFQQPQLVINHKCASGTGEPTASLNRPLPAIDANTVEPVPAVTSPTTLRGSSDYRTLHSAASGRKSMSRNHHKQATMSPTSPSADDFPAPPVKASASRTSTASSGGDGDASAKDGSRTSRFFKRMSNFGGGGKERRKSLMSTIEPAPAPQPVAAPKLQKGADMPPAVVVGDLNVQFPDSLVRPDVRRDGPGPVVLIKTIAVETPHDLNRRGRLPALCRIVIDGQQETVDCRQAIPFD